MLVVGKADIDQINVRILDHLAIVVVRADVGEIEVRAARSEVPLNRSPVANQFFRTAGTDRCDGGPLQLRTRDFSVFGEFGRTREMGPPHESNPDDPNAHHNPNPQRDPCFVQRKSWRSIRMERVNVKQRRALRSPCDDCG